ncbi:MAG: phosphate ABC transporter permease PstA [Spirochaetaceae bacterium]|jgi:phosphate transport system permease protein|nr:phosphate ABC transporter permease PstA [Spirochaetaceae bacterium]
MNTHLHSRTDFLEHALRLAVWAGAAFCAGVFLYITGFIVIRGVPHLSPGLFAAVYTSENVSLLPALLATVYISALSLAIAAPAGIAAAIYLAEYAPRRSKVVACIRVTAETLAGIPSVVYGLFGMLCFVNFLGLGFSLVSGALTLSLMILPLVMRAAEEALRAVPDIWREGSFALGAGRLRTVFAVTLPAARPGILAGVILAIGRVVGESAALIYTAGTVARIPENPLQSARTLAVHIYALSSEGLHTDKAYATAAALLALVLLINTAAAALARRAGTPKGAAGGAA